MTQRIVYFDVVRAVAICLVCIGHSLNMVTLSRPSVVNGWIYSFHMPLFMLLSGFFSSHALQQPFGIFIKRKALQLLVPVVSITILHVFICVVIWGNASGTLLRNEIIGGLWFLRTLFMCYLYVWFFKRLPMGDGWRCIVSIIAAIFIPHGYFLQFNWLLLFFWGGYFLHKYYTSYTRLRAVVTMMATIIFTFLGRHQSPDMLTYTFMLESPHILLWQFITAISGSLTICGIVYFAVKRIASKVWKQLAKVGTYTLGIYAIQTILLEVVGVHFFHIDATRIPFFFSDMVIIPLIGIVATIMSYAIALWLDRYRWGRILFLGMGNTKKTVQ